MSDITDDSNGIEEVFEEHDPHAPPPKGVQPVSSVVMMNFLYWLTAQHPEITRLQGLSERRLLQLVDEFENREQKRYGTQYQWLAGFLRLPGR